jgi:CheY-like chemotaxis protein
MARILVIDDDEQVLQVLTSVLRRRGFDVVQANDGLAALRVLEATPVDLVITDVVMPRMEGLETIRHLRAAGQTRIIAMSGSGSGIGYLDYLDYAEKLGASATFAKPFAPPEIVHAVEQLLAA